MKKKTIDIEKFLLEVERKNMPWLFDEPTPDNDDDDDDDIATPISQIYNNMQKNYTHRRFFGRIF